MEMLSTLNESAVEMFDTLKESTNKQKNQAVLDSLGENADGELTYKGETIGTSKIKTIETVIDYENADVHTNTPNSITFECNLLPPNARVKRIEIGDAVNGTGEVIALEDMVTRDPNYGFEAPYYIMYPKNRLGYSYTIAAVVIFTAETNTYYSFAASGSFWDTPIKIYYEIEE